MSTFTVPIKRILAIEPHPNAEALEFAVIDGYRSIVRKGQFKPGNLVAYIPEGAVVPKALLKRLGLWDEEKACGKLAGKDGNRVKAIRLRGEMSQGLCYSAHNVVADTGVAQVREGDDVSDLLGVTKYEPPIPVAMAGEVFNAGMSFAFPFDVENWKSYPDILQPDEEVIFTEKLHGTCTIVAILPYKDAHPEAFGEKKNILIMSKGLAAKGLALKNNERNKNNLYVRATRAFIARIDEVQRDNMDGVAEPNTILGETFGPGVQDLTYGQEIGFRVFAAAYGYSGNHHYQNWSFVEGALKAQFGFETVPVLYRGPFSEDVMRKYTSGRTTLGAGHIREGIVMVPTQERVDPRIGRVCLKSVSDDYLGRKNGTEYN
jgi:RNA ligase (TIGR02306 family)